MTSLLSPVLPSPSSPRSPPPSSSIYSRPILLLLLPLLLVPVQFFFFLFLFLFFLFFYLFPCNSSCSFLCCRGPCDLFFLSFLLIFSPEELEEELITRKRRRSRKRRRRNVPEIQRDQNMEISGVFRRDPLKASKQNRCH